MDTFYKPFQVARTVFYAVIFSFFIMLSGVSAQAQNPVFTIEGVSVDVTAGNALEAKSKAFEQAQVDAFEIMAERMLSEGAAAKIQTPDLSTISMMIKDFEVTKEQLSAVRYVGTYTFRFDDNAVRRHFSVSGVEYSDVQKNDPVLILPFYQKGDEAIIWSHNNLWMKAWNSAPNLNGLVPVILPLGDLADVGDIGENQALNYSEDRLDNMLRRYGASEAVLAIAIPDPGFENANLLSDQVSGSLTIHLYRTDRHGPEYVQEIRVPGGGGTLGTLLQTSVRKVHTELQRDWKSKTMVKPKNNNRLQVRVNFNNLQQWNDTKRALNRVIGVNDIVLKKLSPKNALVDILFEGEEQRLRLALEQANITLAAPRIDAAAVQNSQSRLRPLVYELYLNRYAPNRNGVGGASGFNAPMRTPVNAPANTGNLGAPVKNGSNYTQRF